MKNILMFLGGLVVGAGATYIYQKNKYEEQINEEFKEAREYRKQNDKEDVLSSEEINKEEVESLDSEEPEENIHEVNEIIKRMHYHTDDIVEKYKNPYVVSPEDFASIPGFDTDTFYYHANDIITNDNNEIVDDVETYLGLSTEDIRDQFGVYEDDCVYIRNMRLKTDFEILREEQDYIRRNGD